MTTLLFVFLACADPSVEEPPPDMQELTWMLLRDFGTDAAVGEAELLAAWIDEAIDAPDEGYALTPPADAYIVDLSFSENLEVQNMAGALVIRRVRGTIDQHAAVVPEEDQSFADGSYERWDRRLVQGDAADWADGGRLVAEDDIEKNGGFGVILPYPMERDYLWIALERGAAVLTRSVIHEEGWADEQNGIYGGFTIEMWLPEEDGMIWMNATWTQVVSVVDEFAEDGFYTDQIIDGSTEVMVGTELYVAGPE
ncbi:MAG: hypothetical protein ACK4YP_05850 [Myxococcota bacterium]